MSYIKKICCVFYLFLGVISVFHEAIGATCGGNINAACPQGYGCVNVAVHGATNYTCVAGASNGACPAGYDWINTADKHAAPTFSCAAGVTNNCPNGQTLVTIPMVQSGQIVGNTYRCENTCNLGSIRISRESTNLNGRRTYCTDLGVRGWNNEGILTVAVAAGPDQRMRISCNQNGEPNCTFRTQTSNCSEGHTCPCEISCN